MSKKKAARASWLRFWPRLLFLIPVAVVLWVPLYNRIEPELGGIPFFYWYQVAWIPLTMLLLLSLRIADLTRSDR